MSHGGTNWITPMHGISQVNGAGAVIWAVLSTPPLNLLHSSRFGCEFITPLSNDSLQFVGYAFVDDTDVIKSKPATAKGEKVWKSLQEAVDTWEGALFKAMCGTIVPEKIFWYLIGFGRIWGIGYYTLLEDSSANIYIKDLHGDRKEIWRCEV
jgi:hypothetical protein